MAKSRAQIKPPSKVAQAETQAIMSLSKTGNRWTLTELKILGRLYFAEKASIFVIQSQLPHRTQTAIRDKIMKLGWAEKRKELYRDKPSSANLENQICDLSEKALADLAQDHARVEEGTQFLEEIAEETSSLSKKLLDTAHNAADMGIDGIPDAHEAIKAAERSTNMYRKAKGLDKPGANQNVQDFSISLPSDMDAVVTITSKPKQREELPAEPVEPVIELDDDDEEPGFDI